MLKRLYHFIDNLRYRLSPGLRIRNCSIGMGVRMRFSKLEDHIKVGDGCDIQGSCLGRYTYIGHDCNLPYTEIGRFCSIAPYVVLAAGCHPKNFVSTSPATYKAAGSIVASLVDVDLFHEDLPYFDSDRRLVARIGSDVWIGERVTLVSSGHSVSIGDGAIVGAGSVVVSDVPAYSIVAGVPARVIGNRFSENTKDALLQIRWWDKSEEWIREHAFLYPDPAKLIDCFHQEHHETTESN